MKLFNGILFLLYFILTSCVADSSNKNESGSLSREPANSSGSTETNTDNKYFSKVNTQNIMLPVSKWKYPDYDLGDELEASMSARSFFKERTEKSILDKFEKRRELFSISNIEIEGLNILVDEKRDYPFKLYFHASLDKHCEKSSTSKAACDRIYLARSISLFGPWEIYTNEGFSQKIEDTQSWKTVLPLNNKNSLLNTFEFKDPSVLKVGSMYYMAYTIYDNNEKSRGPSIGGAYSKDGINWIRLRRPLFMSKEKLSKISFSSPVLRYNDGEFKLWFNSRHGALGRTMGLAILKNAGLHSFTNDRWVIVQGKDRSGIANWSNFSVIKTSEGYFSYGESEKEIDLKSLSLGKRNILEAYSEDGMKWEITGALNYSSNCEDSHLSSFLFEREMYLLSSCFNEKENKSYFFIKKRIGTFENRQNKRCNSSQKYSCSLIHGDGEKECLDDEQSFGECLPVLCHKGYQIKGGHCIKKVEIKKICIVPEINKKKLRQIIGKFNGEFLTVKSIALASRCFIKIKKEITLLDENNWSCSQFKKIEKYAENCFVELEALPQCEISKSKEDYIKSTLSIFKNSFDIRKARSVAIECFHKTKKEITLLDENGWSCDLTQQIEENINSCIKDINKLSRCNISKKDETYIRSIDDYLTNTNFSEKIKSIAMKCIKKTQNVISKLDKLKWSSCDNLEDIKESVSSCFQDVKSLNICRVEPIKEKYIRESLDFFKTAMMIFKTKPIARGCFENIHSSIQILDKKGWSCERAQDVEKVVKRCIANIWKEWF